MVSLTRQSDTADDCKDLKVLGPIASIANYVILAMFGLSAVVAGSENSIMVSQVQSLQIGESPFLDSCLYSFIECDVSGTLPDMFGKLHALSHIDQSEP